MAFKILIKVSMAFKILISSRKKKETKQGVLWHHIAGSSPTPHPRNVPKSMRWREMVGAESGRNIMDLQEYSRAMKC